jgi:putative flavoprotein involved in K+ transport
MRRTDTLVIGGGQAGLAVSWHLGRRGVDHQVLERGTVAQSWTTERWDSLRTITPNWMSRLPGWSYRGEDPDGFMTAAEVSRYLQDYRRSFAAPVLEGVEVLSVRRGPLGFEVRTPDGGWRARDVVVATGATGRPHIPAAAAGLAPWVAQVPLRDYRRPEQLPPGGVLVVGASASGLAVADELAATGRRVVVSVGGHVWLPRSVAGRDIWWWLRESGWLARTVDDVADVDAARREPRIQLFARPGDDVGLAALAARGVELVGRFRGAAGAGITFDDDLPATLARARSRSAAILDHVARTAGTRPVPEPPEISPVADVPRRLRLDRAGIGSVVWATGHRPHHPWLHLPVRDRAGQIVQYRGRTFEPGLFVVGTKFQHRRDSTFLDGVRHDAGDVVDRLVSRPRSPASGPARIPVPRPPADRTPGAHLPARAPMPCIA